MNARCKPGEFAIIAHDVPSCAANIGRVVRVSGPPVINGEGQLTWLIEPVTDEPYLINGSDGNFVRFMRSGERGIEHPDDWMDPVRGTADDPDGADPAQGGA